MRRSGSTDNYSIGPPTKKKAGFLKAALLRVAVFPHFDVGLATRPNDHIPVIFWAFDHYYAEVIVGTLRMAFAVRRSSGHLASRH